MFGNVSILLQFSAYAKSLHMPRESMCETWFSKKRERPFKNRNFLLISNLNLAPTKLALLSLYLSSIVTRKTRHIPVLYLQDNFCLQNMSFKVNQKNEDNLKHEDYLEKTASKMKTTLKMKITSKMKMTSKMKTISKMKTNSKKKENPQK